MMCVALPEDYEPNVEQLREFARGVEAGHEDLRELFQQLNECIGCSLVTLLPFFDDKSPDHAISGDDPTLESRWCEDLGGGRIRVRYANANGEPSAWVILDDTDVVSLFNAELALAGEERRFARIEATDGSAPMYVLITPRQSERLMTILAHA